MRWLDAACRAVIWYTLAVCFGCAVFTVYALTRFGARQPNLIFPAAHQAPR